jgi:hypothetical protein
MNPLDRTAEQIIEAALEFYESHPGAGPEVYAYFETVIADVLEPWRAKKPPDD